MPEVTGTAAKVEVEKTDTVGSTETVPAANGTSDNGVLSISPEKKLEAKTEADSLLAQGKRHLFVKDYPNAVVSLGNACALLGQTYGDMADECADAYFNYGRALLELAREESNVLGTDPEKEESEEGEEEGGEEEDGKQSEDDKDEEKVGNEDSKAENKEECESDAKEDKENTEAVDETIDTTKEVNEEEEDGRDLDNLELAWEVLEVAKKIYERQKADAKLAETFLYLGEVGLESESYSCAIEDMKRCIEIQKQILPPDHRDIAETYFQLGIACSLSNDFDEAISSFKTSSEILETRIKNLETNGAPEGEIEKNPFYSVEKEISEIKGLLPEIKAKVADMEDFKQETIKSMMVALKERSQSSDGSGPSSAASSAVPVTNGSTPKPATDISHLVRKKRKIEEEVPSGTSAKKSCSDEEKK